MTTLSDLLAPYTVTVVPMPVPTSARVAGAQLVALGAEVARLRAVLDALVVVDALPLPLERRRSTDVSPVPA